MKLKKTLLATTLTIGLSGATVVTIALVSKHTQPQKSAEIEIGNYQFNFGKGLKNPQNHYASEFTFASYYDSRTNANGAIAQPELKNTTSLHKQFWPYNLELSFDYKTASDEDYKRKQDPLFTLVNRKNGNPIDFLKETHNIYYHSYANDLEGALYLQVLLENKKPANKKEKDLLAKSISSRERIDSWKRIEFRLNGFKKLNVNDQNELLRSKISKDSSIISTFPIAETSNLREALHKGYYEENSIKIPLNSVSDLIDNKILPSTTLEQGSTKELIQKQNEIVKKFLSITSPNLNNPLLIIDWEKPIWFSKSADDKSKLIMYYSIKRQVAKASNLNLFQTSTFPIDEVQSQKIHFNFFKLKAIAKEMVEVKPKTNINIANFSQIGTTALKFTQNHSSSQPNSSHGYFDELNLQFKEINELKKLLIYTDLSSSEQNLNNYTLAFDTSLNSLLNKKTTASPYVGSQQADKITFAYSLSAKDINAQNGINKFYGTFILGGFKTN
ncbi:hypothetical protein MCFN_01595 [Mycoplasmopsis californica]|uniref:Lipoprotein n=1 Tax=Mycoplasmopsis californica TaxID=2113 RepID=A0A059XRN6_9BACT|nr:hypothetical protein [Mycoplasmopsis californica]AIA29463.1 hypothetical protein MCFN_01595 [Mycoplasmopsis californica]